MVRLFWRFLLVALIGYVIYEKHIAPTLVEEELPQSPAGDGTETHSTEPSSPNSFKPVLAPVADAPVRICSQNLFRFGASRSRDPKKREKQKRAIVTRMKQAKCDVVATQELAGGTPERSKQILAELANALSERMGTPYSYYIGESHDRYIRNGFLLRDDLGKVHEVRQFYRMRLPRLRSGRSAARRYSRGPLGLLIQLPKRRLFVVTMHFKSMRNSDRDSSGTKFEDRRLEMAAGLRESVLRAAAEYGPDVVPVVLGDRNSADDSASAAVLEGVRTLTDFTSSRCEVDEKLRADCGNTPERDYQLRGLFAYRKNQFPGRYRGGSFRYKKREQLIDEILLEPRHLKHVTRADGTIAIGFAGQFYKGSDHKLLWAELLL